MCSLTRSCTFLTSCDKASAPRVVVCRFGSSVAAVRMAPSADDICHAQTEVEAYHRLQQLQGKHVPKLLGYGHSGQGFCVATSYIEACHKQCWLMLIHYLRPPGSNWRGCA